jgi:RNA polymerase sigma-70 factor (ECF subfamily)
MELATDDQLLAAADRDRASFTEFYNRYERAMLAFFLRRTHDAELAADLTAEVFAAVLLACRRLGMAPLELDDDDLRRVEACAGADALLDTLPADEREAVRARVLEEQSYEEIAGRLECSQAVVRKRVSRGLARLRNHLGEEGM